MNLSHSTLRRWLLVPTLALGLSTIGAASSSAQVDLSGTLQAPYPAASTGVAGASAPTVVYPATAQTPASPEFADGELIVRFKRRASPAKRARIHAAAGTNVRRALLLPNTYLVRFNRHRDVRDVARIYRSRGAVKYAEPNFIRTYDSTIPNDPTFGELWALHNQGQTINGAAGTADADINAPEAWDVTQGSSSVVVGVVDTGVDYNHTDLAPNIWTNPADPPGNGDEDLNGVTDDHHGYDFLDGDSDPMDTVGHGSHVAGIVAARGNNGTGTAGVSWRSQIAPLRVCDSIGCDDAALADAFTYAGQMGFRIVNASISGSTDPGSTVSAAIAASPNTLFVAAAGNGGGDEVGDNIEAAPEYPCSYTAANVVCVGATDSSDRLATFSNFGSTSVDLAAPGQYVLSAWKRAAGQDQHAYQSGTSQAAPQVAGAAALDLAKTPSKTTAQLRSDLLTNAESVPALAGSVATGGRLNVAAMLPAPQPPSDAVSGLDGSFDSDGQVVVGSFNTVGRAVALQTDNKIVAAGPTQGPSSQDFGIARLNANGSFDTGFGGGGVVAVNLGNATPTVDVAHAIAIQPDGKIVVAGYTLNASSIPDFAVVRLNSNGTLDTSFDGDGRLTLNVPTSASGEDYVYGVAVTSTSIVLAGLAQNATYDFAVVRLHSSNGALDSSFDGDGKAFTDFGSLHDRAEAVTLQSDGKIVVGGSNNFVGSPAQPQDFAVARYNTNGSLDTTFSGDGKVTTDFGGQLMQPGDAVYSLAIQSDGMIVAGGTAPDNGATPGRFALARYRTNGTLDPSFDVDGKVTTDLPGSTGTGAGGRAVALQSDGKLVMGGWHQPTGSVSDRTMVHTRYNADGSPDATFGTDGKLITNPCAGEEEAYDVAIQPTDGKIVTVGRGCGGALVTRHGEAPRIIVTPNTELDPVGASVTVEGHSLPPNATLGIHQCGLDTNGSGEAYCILLHELTTDPNGHALTTADVSYEFQPGDTCPDSDCKIYLAGAEAPISFRSPTSLETLPSDGAILQSDAIKVGDSITAGVTARGDAATGAPTGNVDFFWCGPVVSPATCAQGGTSLGSFSLTSAGGNTATATSASVSFPSAGRYCFRAVYAGDDKHRAVSDSSKAACVAVRAAPGTGPVALDDFYQGAPGDTIADGSPGLILNDVFGIGQAPTAELLTPPTNGSLQGGLNPDGSFTYVPDTGMKRVSTGPTDPNAQQDSEFAVASADGGRVFFTTTQALAAGDTDTNRDLYERVGSTTNLVSTGPAGGNGAFDVRAPNQNCCFANPDGTHVFFSTAEQLVAGDTDSAEDIYERFAGTTTLVSVGTIGTTFFIDHISDNGTRVLFTTTESLLAADTDSAYDVYERSGGTTTLITTGPQDSPSGSGHSFYGASSPDGTRVYFTTSNQLVASDTGSAQDVYQRSGGSTTLVSAGTHNSFGAVFDGASKDGTHAYFTSAQQLDAADTDARIDIYDRSGATTTLVSTGPAGGNGAFDPTFRGASANGSHVFFTTNESLVTGDTDSESDIYDRSGGTTTLVSAGTTTGATYRAASSDGTRVIFSTVDQAGAGDTDNTIDLYERSGGTNTRLTTGPNGGNEPGVINLTYRGASADATHVYFETSEHLVPADGDSSIDIYERTGTTTNLVSTGPGDTNFTFQVNVFRGNATDGSQVFFESDMPLTADDGDGTPWGWLDVFTFRSANVTSDSFTYRIQDGTGTSAPAKVTIDLTGTTTTEGTRYRGTRYQGTRYRGTRYRGTRYRGTRYRTLFDATLTTYAECGSRWVWVNPAITVFEQTYLEVSAALYNAAGDRIATSNGFIAQGDFFGDLGEPLSVEWPVWNAPVPAGGVYAQVFVEAVPADPNHAPYEITSNVVGCQT